LERRWTAPNPSGIAPNELDGNGAQVGKSPKATGDVPHRSNLSAPAPAPNPAEPEMEHHTLSCSNFRDMRDRMRELAVLLG